MINPLLVQAFNRNESQSAEIVKWAWENSGYIAFSGEEAGKLCESVPVGMQATCVSAGQSCKPNDTKCKEAFTRYVAALNKGYKKTFTEFLKESKIMGYVGLGISAAAAYFSDPTETPGILTPEEQRKADNRKIAISIGGVVVGTVVIYMLIKHYKK